MQTVTAYRPSVNRSVNWRCHLRRWWRETRKLTVLAAAMTVALW